MGLAAGLLLSLPALGAADERPEPLVRNEEALAPEVRRALERQLDEIDPECRERIHAFRVVAVRVFLDEMRAAEPEPMPSWSGDVWRVGNA